MLTAVTLDPVDLLIKDRPLLVTLKIDWKNRKKLLQFFLLGALSIKIYKRSCIFFVVLDRLKNYSIAAKNCIRLSSSESTAQNFKVLSALSSTAQVTNCLPFYNTSQRIIDASPCSPVTVRFLHVLIINQKMKQSSQCLVQSSNHTRMCTIKVKNLTHWSRECSSFYYVHLPLKSLFSKEGVVTRR